MADIIIKGMGMPKTCQECPLNVSIYTYDGGDETCALNAWDGYSEQPKTTRHPDCPLVPLPEGHGRLIDADRLFEVMGQDADRWIVDEVSMIETDDVLDAIQNAPTIVPAEGGNADGI